MRHTLRLKLETDLKELKALDQKSRFSQPMMKQLLLLMGFDSKRGINCRLTGK